MAKREPWRKIKWYGDYYYGYYGDDDGRYTGSDHTEIRVGDFGNNFEYKGNLDGRNIKGKYHMSIRYVYDYQTSFQIFNGNFKTKKRAKMMAHKEILKFENDRERVMEVWRQVMTVERRVAIFKFTERFSDNKCEWIASGFAGAGAWQVASDEKTTYRPLGSAQPRIDGITNGGAGRFLSLYRGSDWNNNYPYQWTGCECGGGGMGGGSRPVPYDLNELEPILINCLRNSEFDEKKYKWMLLRQNKYGVQPPELKFAWKYTT